MKEIKKEIFDHQVTLTNIKKLETTIIRAAELILKLLKKGHYLYCWKRWHSELTFYETLKI